MENKHELNRSFLLNARTRDLFSLSSFNFCSYSYMYSCRHGRLEQKSKKKLSQNKRHTRSLRASEQERRKKCRRQRKMHCEKNAQNK